MSRLAVDGERRHWAYDQSATFEGARRTCVESDGDLASFANDYNFTEAQQLFDGLSVR